MTRLAPPVGSSITLELLPRFPRPLVRWPSRIRLAPGVHYTVAGVGRVRITWELGTITATTEG